MKEYLNREKIFKRLNIIVISFILILTGYVKLKAKVHPDAGTTSASFLKIPAGSRSSSMGGGYASFSDDIFSSFYNPAGTANIEKRNFAFMHNIHFENIKQYIFVYGFAPSFTEKYRDYISFSLNYLSYGSMDRRSGIYETDPFNPSPVEGSFKSKDIALSINYSIIKSTSFMIGSNIKYINQSIDSKSGHAFAFDIGGIKKVNIKNRDFDLGFSVLNIGTKIKIISDAYSLPLAFKFGISTEYKKTFLSLDLLKYNDNYPFFIIGFENRLTKELYLRLGYKYRMYGNELGFWSGFSSGFGFKYNNFLFGYSLNSYGDLGYSHKIELSIKYK